MNQLKPTDQMADRINKNADQVMFGSLNILRLQGFVTQDEFRSIKERLEAWEKDFYSAINKDNKQ
tara:strand:+ start:487 stop:681 length:195 start_codon:yes stop_codon:yes gene_type:complete